MTPHADVLLLMTSQPVYTYVFSIRTLVMWPLVRRYYVLLPRCRLLTTLLDQTSRVECVCGRKSTRVLPSRKTADHPRQAGRVQHRS